MFVHRRSVHSAVGARCNARGCAVTTTEFLPTGMYQFLCDRRLLKRRDFFQMRTLDISRFDQPRTDNLRSDHKGDRSNRRTSNDVADVMATFRNRACRLSAAVQSGLGYCPRRLSDEEIEAWRRRDAATEARIKGFRP